MSASPSQTTNPAKRPLEDASSPSRSNEQPDAKRPALDKVIKNGHDDEVEEEEIIVPLESNGVSAAGELDESDAKAESACSHTRRQCRQTEVVRHWTSKPSR